MELQPYLDIFRRRLWFIVGAVVVVALAAGLASRLRTPTYTASSRVYLLPDNPAEQLTPAQASVRDPSRFVQAQIAIVESEAVARLAATYVPGVSADQLQRNVSVSSSSTSDVLEVSASDSSATTARDMANAVVKGYIENRRQSAVSVLQQAAKDLNDTLVPLQANITDLDARIAAASRPGAPPGDDPTALKSARDAAAAQYQTLYARQQQLVVDISLQRGGAEVIAPAKTPTAPVSPRPTRDAAAGGLVGLFFSSGLVLLREQLDDRFRSTADVERALGLPILAQLPFDDDSARVPDRLATVDRSQGALSEAVRSLRTTIRYTALDRPVKTLVITSALPGEGKSMVSANLAASCAEAGLRTVLIGADLRRPRLSALFGISNRSPGLTNAVVGLNGVGHGTGSEPDVLGDGGRTSSTTARPQGVGALVAKPIRNLAFLPPGPIPPNPAELLGSQRMQEVLVELAANSQLVIVDTPPVLPVTDAAVLSAQVDGVILVVVMNETRQSSALQAKAILEATNARLLGVVLNKAPTTAAPYYYAGYSGDAAGFNGAGSFPTPAGNAPSASRRRWRRGK